MQDQDINFHEIFGSLLEWNPDHIKVLEKLPGGESRDVWLIKHQASKYVLHIDKPFARSLTLDRSNIEGFTNTLHKSGITSRLIFSDPDKGILVNEYIPGKQLSVDELNENACLTSVANLLKRLHSQRVNAKVYDLVGGIKRYKKLIDTSDAQRWSDEALAIFEQVSDGPLSFCHNDLLVQNIIKQDENLFLIDWEYAGLGNPLFDLATIVQHHQLDQERTEIFLKAYYGVIDQSTLVDFERYSQIYDRLLALWYLLLLKEKGHSIAVNSQYEALRLRINKI